jgi:hypothetical protein
LPQQPAELLVNQGWPQAGPEDEALSYMLGYLQDAKSTIRQAHIAASSGGKKKKGKQEEEKKEITTCVLFYNTQFPDFQKRVLEVLQKQEFVDDVIQGKDYIAQIREMYPDKADKKMMDNALKFAAFTVQKAAEKGAAQTLKLEIPFQEQEVLEANKVFLYENMPTITQTLVFNVEDAAATEQFPNAAQAKEKATPGAPIAFFC